MRSAQISNRTVSLWHRHVFDTAEQPNVVTDYDICATLPYACLVRGCRHGPALQSPKPSPRDKCLCGYITVCFIYEIAL